MRSFARPGIRSAVLRPGWFQTVSCYPPPPPPPPQDIYAQGAAIPSASDALLHAAYSTTIVSVVSSIGWLFAHGFGITERAEKPVVNNVQGLHTKAQAAVASADSAGGGHDTSITKKPTKNVGDPDTPAAPAPDANAPPRRFIVNGAGDAAEAPNVIITPSGKVIGADEIFAQGLEGHVKRAITEPISCAQQNRR